MKINWQTKKLGEVCIVGAGNSAPQKKELFTDGKYPFFRTSDVGVTHIGEINKSVDYLNDMGTKGMRLYKKGTILFPKSGASTFLNHRVIMGIDGYVSSHLATIKANNSVLYSNYLFYFLQEIKAQDLIQDHRYPSLNLPVIERIEISYPESILEQKRIVKILDEAFEKIEKAKENAEKNLQNSKELFESYLQNTFTNPEKKWKEKTLGEVCDDLLQGINTTTDKTVFMETGIPILQAKEIGENKLELGKCKFITEKRYNNGAERYKPKKGDILYNNIGSSLGRSIEVVWDFPFTIAWNVMRIIPNRNIVFPRFLNYTLQSRNIFESILKETKGVGMPFISKKNLVEIVISLPEIKDQKVIVEKLDALSEQTKKLAAVYRQKLSDLEELRKSILNKAFKVGLYN